MWLDNLQMLTGNINDTRYDDSMPRAGPVRISHASPEQMEIWRKEREELMAKRSAIMEDYKAGMLRTQIAEKHGISLQAVHSHIHNDKKAKEAARTNGAATEQPSLLAPTQIKKTPAKPMPEDEPPTLPRSHAPTLDVAADSV